MFGRSLSGLLIAVLAFFYALGSSGAAMACASPAAAVEMPMAPGQPCDGKTSKAHDCAVACAPLCMATVPEVAGVEPPPRPRVALSAVETRQLLSHAIRPEPPPPRLSSI